MIRDYELGLVINPDLNDEQLEQQFLRIGKNVDAQGGEVVRLDKWGRRRMSYMIERHRDGYYAFMSLRMDSRAVREIENELRLQENVLRHLMTFVDPRIQAERQRRAQEDAARVAANAARVEAERAAFAQAVEQAPVASAQAVEQAPAAASAQAVEQAPAVPEAEEPAAEPIATPPATEETEV